MGAGGGLRSATILCAVLISVTVPLIPAQTAKASPDAGPYRGKVVTEPESLSGLWGKEASKRSSIVRRVGRWRARCRRDL